MAGLLIVGMQRVALRIDAAVVAEQRVERYSVLSTQVSTFIVVAAESLQSGLPVDQRVARLDTVTANITRTFAGLRSDLGQAVAEARELGFDEQSRRATQSIGIARMEALFLSTRDAFLSHDANRERLQGYIDIFAIGFDPLLNGVITDELRARSKIIDSIADLRRRLTLTALGVAGAVLLMMAGYYLGLVRPQFARLDILRRAAQQIARQEFAISLPQDSSDEIGSLFVETSRMATALATREAEVAREWDRLNTTIAARTEDLRAANQELARIDENRRRFFADISHELRTPLTVILMEAQLGQKGIPDPAAAFETIEARALRLNRRIDDLLRIARSETGQLALEAGAFDLSQVLREATEEAESELRSAGMQIRYVGAAPVPVIGDRNWIRQVILSLIQNAARHARSGGLIALQVELTPDFTRIHVIDNGPGIDADQQVRIFDRFEQGSGSARSEGFGIGLSLARWVVEQQGGTIAVTSPLPRAAALGDAPGTKVTVGIPSGRT
ncbi:HAMP domain-containing sensor histidine kinase [Puniceibacterium sp. IMCC21224]|uniref:sensor histidine kinase n=1 Tax=Puniceibacterium sp. IMCC21224 TaxID=1618204 RepID=UPI001E3B3D6E|nr:HAMP domain-containing sensor histidine kinase [Puniceibacterium sp. IMCC21224]